MMQNRPWRRVIGEGLIIVVSVLAALAVDAWWDQGQAKRLELEIQRAVLAELQADSAALEATIATNQEHLAAIEGFVRSRPEELTPIALAEGRDLALSLLGFSSFSSVGEAGALLVRTPPADESGVSVRAAVGEAIRAVEEVAEEHWKIDELQNQIRLHLARYAVAAANEPGWAASVSVVDHEGSRLALMRQDQSLVATVLSKSGLQRSYIGELRTALAKVSEAIGSLDG